MKKVYILSGIALIVVLIFLSLGPSETNTPAEPSIQYAATRSDTVRDMLWLADVGKSDIVYDLGSGDGRIVIAAVRDFGASQAVGIEIDPNRITESRKNAQKAGVANRVEFIEGDLFTTDFSQASVVTLFLGHRPNIKLRPKILTVLKPDTRILSYQFGMGEWETDKALTVRRIYFGMIGRAIGPFDNNPRVPDYTGNESQLWNSNKILMWIVPAPIAGIWRGKIQTENEQQDIQLTLHQRLSEAYGKFELSGENKLEGGSSIELWGSHIHFLWRPDNIPDRKELKLDGQVLENTMWGTIVITKNGEHKEYEWKAQRDKVDFTGTWEWPCATGPRQVKLRIEREDGNLTATYLDQDRILPVTDFYDFGGGFYFTLLIGLEREGFIKTTEDTGWLIGEAVFEQGSLTGRVEFYPSRHDAPAPVIGGDWKPRLVKPAH